MNTPDPQPFDLNKLRDKTLAALRALPALLGRGVALLNPLGLGTVLARTTETLQRRWTVQLVQWLFCGFFLTLGLDAAVNAGSVNPKLAVTLIIGYAIWAVINSIVHGVQRSDHGDYRPLYMAVFDHTLSVALFTLGLVLLTGVATTASGAAIWMVVVGMVFFVIQTVLVENNITYDAN
jgi:hypothetical protein